MLMHALLVLLFCFVVFYGCSFFVVCESSPTQPFKPLPTAPNSNNQPQPQHTHTLQIIIMALFLNVSRAAVRATAFRSVGCRRAFSDVPSHMRAVVVNETGPAEVLTYVDDHPVPEVQDGQVLVRNEFAGINFIDTYHRGGLYPRELPFIGGQEGGGRIVATTPAAEAGGFAVGDAVAYSVFGAYAEYTVRI